MKVVTLITFYRKIERENYSINVTVSAFSKKKVIIIIDNNNKDMILLGNLFESLLRAEFCSRQGNYSILTKIK